MRLYLCDVRMTDRPSLMTLRMQSQRKRRALGSIPVVGSSCNKLSLFKIVFYFGSSFTNVELYSILFTFNRSPNNVSVHSHSRGKNEIIEKTVSSKHKNWGISFGTMHAARSCFVVVSQHINKTLYSVPLFVNTHRHICV